MIRVTEEMVPMRDGTLLATDVFVDETSRGPAMLIRTPYGRAQDREEFDPIALARMGFAVVIQDVRGRFDSQGICDPFVQEASDGADAVAWCRTSDWCNGKVATMGRSYVGSTALLAAAHSRVDACSPQLTAGDIRDGWMYENGILRQGFVQPWAAGFAGGSLKSQHYKRWQSFSDRGYWDQISVNRRVSKMNTAMFHVAGWFDIFCEGSLDLYARMVDGAPEPARRSQRLLVGPWTHTDLFNSQTDEIDFGLAANGRLAMTHVEVAQWLFDAVSGGQLLAEAKVFLMGENRWLDLAAWPPRAKSLKLFLDDTGGLSRRPQPHVGRVQFKHRPKDPVPTWGGRSLGPALPWAGPKDQSGVESRTDVVTFTTDVLDKDLVIVGEAKAGIYASSTASSADLVVKLVDVYPDGRSM
ncbi:MAG TPA: CocE/NonD family hydrolase, partial [Actinomycetota bacterium]|nr:CocE/NonD family hydrolase [Actinomycetota bacterium]